jgi:hypothetical protein
LTSSFSSSVFTTVLSTNNPQINSSSANKNSDTVVPSSGKFHAKRLFNDALAYSQVHYNNDLLSELVHVSLPSFSKTNELKSLLKKKSQSLNLMDLQIQVLWIREYLRLENEKLQEAIQSFQNVIEEDSLQEEQHQSHHFSIGRPQPNQVEGKKEEKSAPSSKPEVNVTTTSISNSRIPKKANTTINPTTNKKFTEGKVSEDKRSTTKKMFEAKDDGTEKHFHAISQKPSQSSQTTQNNNHLEETTPPSSRKNSRFRDKLKDARDELFMVDDL